MSSIKYYIIKGNDELGNFNNFKNNTKNITSIFFVNKYENIDKNDNYKIIPTTVDDTLLYHNDDNFIFSNNNLLLNLNILENKSIFTKFMMDNFIDNIPYCYFYNYDNTTFINNNIDDNFKKIQKPNNLCASINIYIINKINFDLKNIVVSKYHDHIEFYVGHFLIKDGIIIKKIYFKTFNNIKNYIQKGSIKNYNILNNIDCNDIIFENIFKKLNYCGFSHSDFIIENNKIIIFEINSRIGGSLSKDVPILNDFLNGLVQNFY
jgi:hypothetical protein